MVNLLHGRVSTYPGAPLPPDYAATGEAYQWEPGNLGLRGFAPFDVALVANYKNDVTGDTIAFNVSFGALTCCATNAGGAILGSPYDLQTNPSYGRFGLLGGTLGQGSITGSVIDSTTPTPGPLIVVCRPDATALASDYLPDTLPFGGILEISYNGLGMRICCGNDGVLYYITPVPDNNITLGSLSGTSKPVC